MLLLSKRHSSCTRITESQEHEHDVCQRGRIGKRHALRRHFFLQPLQESIVPEQDYPLALAHRLQRISPMSNFGIRPQEHRQSLDANSIEPILDNPRRNCFHLFRNQIRDSRCSKQITTQRMKVQCLHACNTSSFSIIRVHQESA